MVVLGGPGQDAVIRVGLDVLLQILRSLEGLPAEVALVWLEWDIDADVGGDVVSLDGGSAACTPLAGQVEVVGALAAYMTVANVVLRGLAGAVESSREYIRRGSQQTTGARRSLPTGRRENPSRPESAAAQVGRQPGRRPGEIAEPVELAAGHVVELRFAVRVAQSARPLDSQRQPTWTW